MRRARRIQRRRRLIARALAFLVVALLMFVAGCSLATGRAPDQGRGDPPNPGAPSEEEEGIPVAVHTVQTRDLTAALRLSGTLEPEQAAPITSLVGGRVAQVYVEEGREVAEDEPILRLSAGELAARLRQAEAGLSLAVANLEQARLQMEHAQREYVRIEALMRRNQASRFDVQQAEHQLRLARHQAEVIAPAQVEEARASLAALRAQYAETQVLAPIAGTVARLDVDAGGILGAGQVVGLVVDVSTLRLVVPVSELHIARFAPGAEVRVSVPAAAGSEVTGAVLHVPPLPAEGDKTYPVEVQVQNPEGRLKAGMTAEVVFTLETRRGAVAVPTDALVDSGDDTFVYVVEDGHARRRTVTTGIRDGDWVEILSGLQPGDVVVSAGQESLYDGAAVRVTGADRP